ncbi:hypothetical protein TrRE_jg12559, partial [Triparma retinervis]
PLSPLIHIHDLTHYTNGRTDNEGGVCSKVARRFKERMEENRGMQDKTAPSSTTSSTSSTLPSDPSPLP